MKKILLTLALILFGVSVFSQKELKKSEIELPKDSKFISVIENSNDRGIPFPDGSKLILNLDNSFNILLPKGYYFIVENNIGEVSRVMSSGSVTCSCGSGGCSPVLYKGKVYCVMANCNECSMSTGKVASRKDNENLILGFAKEFETPIKFLVDEFSNNSKSVFGEIINSFETQKPTYDYLFKNLFKSEEVRKNILDFYNLVYNGNIPDFINENKMIPNNDYKYVKAVIYGNLCLLPIPNTTETVMYKVYYGTKAKCTCESGSGCVKDTLLGAVFCDAGNCKQCKLTY